MPTEAQSWIEDHVPIGGHWQDAKGAIQRLPEEQRIAVALTLTRGITNANNMALARGVAGIRVLEDMVQEAMDERDELRAELKEMKRKWSGTLEARIELLEDDRAMRVETENVTN